MVRRFFLNTLTITKSRPVNDTNVVYLSQSENLTHSSIIFTQQTLIFFTDINFIIKNQQTK